MDPRLRTAMEKCELEDKIEQFIDMEIKTCKDMASVKEQTLKEELLFNYPELNKFERLRRICVKEINQSKQICPKVDSATEPIHATPIENKSGPVSSTDKVNVLSKCGPPTGEQVIVRGAECCDTIDSVLNLDLRYSLNQKIRGIGVIFLNKEFTCHLQDRNGAGKDGDNFFSLFEQMRLDTRLHIDLTCEEIKREIQEIALTDHSQYGMLAVAISTHGDEGDLLYGSDKTYSLYRDIVSPFKPDNCPGLTEKPKIFVIQSCRGDKVGSSVCADGPERPCVTLDSDFLVAHSTVLGYKAFRDKELGSWFVTSLREIFEKYRERFNLMDMLTFVNQRVIQESIKKSGNSDKYVQTCQLESTLTKLAFF